MNSGTCKLQASSLVRMFFWYSYVFQKKSLQKEHVPGTEIWRRGSSLTWYRLRILETHPWDTRSCRLMTHGRTPAAAISTILSRMWFGSGRPLMNTPPNWLTRPWPVHHKLLKFHSFVFDTIIPLDCLSVSGRDSLLFAKHEENLSSSSSLLSAVDLSLSPSFQTLKLSRVPHFGFKHHNNSPWNGYPNDPDSGKGRILRGLVADIILLMVNMFTFDLSTFNLKMERWMDEWDPEK